MSDALAHRAVELGAVTPARSRHAGRRSAVALLSDAAVVGTADGDLLAYDRTLTERWRSSAGDGAVVATEPFGDAVAVGERGPDGEIRLHDAVTGAVRWRYRTADDIGDPATDTRFQLPFVAALGSTTDRLYAAARRYERSSGRRSAGSATQRGSDGRRFESVVYALDSAGTVDWRYRTDASPIAVDADGDRIAIAYNRCPGAHQHGLVVLDAVAGTERYRWDPESTDDRRVGDVSLCEDGVAGASHGDYRGYRHGPDATERWAVDLATPVERGGERLYAYPNHVHATPEGVVFVTGNTYPTEGRETDGLHPDEHTAFGYTPTGERVWSASVGGFAGGIATDGERVAVPGAQHFRTRDPDRHGLRTFAVDTGVGRATSTDGVVTAAAIRDGTVAAVEEPVAYHDGDDTLGAYRLHLADG
jgi:hypothetical protein